MFDRKSEIVLDEQVLSLENALTVKTSELGNLTYGDQLSVDGAAYKVRHEPMRMADGLLSVVLLESIKSTAVLNKLLLEDGFYFLLEDSSFLILEA